jgi:RNA polymerase sigma-70 factor (ECF subfamily)
MKNHDNVVPFSGKKPGSSSDRSLEEHDDDELMLMARGGVEEAFDALVRRHQGVASRVASRVLGPIPLADDAVQNTFLAIYNHIHDYQPRGKFRRFMFQILINHCRLILRSAGRDKRLGERLFAVARAMPGTADESILEREKSREIDRVLSRLSYKLRIVIVLRFAAELSYSEIGQVLKIPIGTVKSRLNTGIVKMRRIMGGKRP